MYCLAFSVLFPDNSTFAWFDFVSTSFRLSHNSTFLPGKSGCRTIRKWPEAKNTDFQLASVFLGVARTCTVPLSLGSFSHDTPPSVEIYQMLSSFGPSLFAESYHSLSLSTRTDAEIHKHEAPGNASSVTRTTVKYSTSDRNLDRSHVGDNRDSFDCSKRQHCFSKDRQLHSEEIQA